MNYEEKIEYAEPLVIEKRLMQQLIDPGTDTGLLMPRLRKYFLPSMRYLDLRIRWKLKFANLFAEKRNRMRHSTGGEEGNDQKD